ncbi:hypothetical protein PGTUg99_008364 [Puccinia graminis f. sp. tritici]|uniref:Uncharacterized protein n=1 Tax=Puccinia graminis f. sp. tritici TaxID=56615 RepID=A0A5B0LSS2_PUCGR|nr:hypothetical protein PGTUg99_008364 [Puccinia graminis f. sp. tritici]
MIQEACLLLLPRPGLAQSYSSRLFCIGPIYIGPLVVHRNFSPVLFQSFSPEFLFFISHFIASLYPLELLIWTSPAAPAPSTRSQAPVYQMHFSNFSNLPSVIFMLLIVLACATGRQLFKCPKSHYGYCAFEDLLTIPINYAFGPADAPYAYLSHLLTCEHSKLPVGTPKNTCCDKPVGDVDNRSADDPLIVWYNDYIQHGCHEVPNAI